MPLRGRIAFKPTSSIKKPQATVNREGESATFELPKGSRHDPCVAIRAVPVVRAMCQLVLADALLMSRCSLPFADENQQLVECRNHEKDNNV